MNHLFLLAALLFSLSASAGVVNGGGGKGVVCRNPDGSVKSVELLDFWEARTLHGRTLGPIAGDLRLQVNEGISRLRDSYRLRATGVMIDADGHKQEAKDQELFELHLKENVKIFFSGNSKRVLRLRNVTLEQTSDAFEVARPSNCEFEQIVNYQRTGQVLINQDLYEALDQTNQAALILHEAYYQTLTTFAEEANSIRVRRAIGFIFDGANRFVLPPETTAKLLYKCRSKQIPDSKYVISVFDSGKNEEGLEAFAVEFTRLNGSGSLIGTSSHVSLSRAASTPYARMIKSGKCSSTDLSNAHSHSHDGPVEFDRETLVGWRCLKGKMSVYIEATLPGIGKQPVENLYCAKN